MAPSWWRGAVFYEIYVRSFADSNDDGIGDLPGITSKLDYLRSLGVDGLWLTPFYPSPQKDHGYDVADYCEVNPEYGTLADFDQLVGEAHQRGLNVLVDLVPNHTSDQHPWFQAAISSPENPHRSRYHFAPSKPDGSLPNNWQSEFGGPAWSKDGETGEWYLHLFAPEQPDLNWWDPAVPEEFRHIVRFWLDRGADGFRIDVAAGLYKRKDLADQPVIMDPRTGMPRRFPFAFTIVDQPEVHEVYRDWRRILNEYEPRRVLVGEISEPGRQTKYIRADQLDMAFAFMAAPWEASHWKRWIDVDRNALHGPGIAASWTMSSHDSVRHVTRLGGGETGRQRARAALLLLLGLPGQVFLYQGEELGLEEADVPVDARQDPWFIHTGGRASGRDGCRVPLPWQKGKPHAGFSSASPWLPTPPGWDSNAVDAQERSDDSFLKLYRRVLKLRKTMSRWLPTAMGWEAAPRGVLRYQRALLTVACNFTSGQVELTQPGRLLMASQTAGVRLQGGRLTLPANTSVWIQNVPSAHP